MHATSLHYLATPGKHPDMGTHDAELLTRATVWLALSLYVAGEIARRRSAMAAGLWLNRLGCAAFLAHVACAFHFYHNWSHSAAYAATGAGIYMNYLFALVWIASALRNPTRGWIIWSVRGFFWFMIFNGAVVFARSTMRGYGLLLCVALIACWWPRRKSVGE